jgi:hypothetical protein
MATRPWPTTGGTRIAVEGLTAQGVNWANIFWAGSGLSTAPTVAQLNTFAQSFYGAFNTHLWALMGKDANLERCVVNWYGAQPVQIVGEYSAVTAGGSSNDTEVDSLSACISWTIGATWRGGKPRTYMAALPTEAFGTSNTLDSSWVTTLESGASAFRTAVNALQIVAPTDVTLGCMSFFSGNAPRPVANFFPFSASTVHPRIDSMRRRLGREIT